jgi:signal transduction histidine kinase
VPTGVGPGGADLRAIRWEVHDRTIQRLAALAWRADRAPGGEGLALAAEVRAIADELRDIVLGDVAAIPFDGGLGAALRRLVTDQERAGAAMRLIFEERGDPLDSLPRGVAWAVYRIAREALLNAVRHSGATVVATVLRHDPGGLAIRVADDGTGIRPSDLSAGVRHPHAGLQSMAGRADAIGARISVVSGTRGTRIALAWRR